MTVSRGPYRMAVVGALLEDIREACRSPSASKVLRTGLTQGQPAVRDALVAAVLNTADVTELVKLSCHRHAGYVIEDIIQVGAFFSLPPPSPP